VPDLPETIRDIAHLEDLLSVPTPEVIEHFDGNTGDVLVLGVGGKMGPSLARMARRVRDACGTGQRIIGVSRFSSPGLRTALEADGIETLACDLLDRREVDDLPDAENVIYMPGTKFGTAGDEATTWALNAYLPGVVCERYRGSRIVAFSTGNVYGLTPAHTGGSRESDALRPDGDYAWSCVGRERVLEHFSRAHGIPMTILRLNYAVEMRYGVLLDIARRVWAGEPVDVTNGCLNALWQGDANAMALLALGQVATPPTVLNLTGPETLSVRRVATEFGRLLGREVVLTGEEAADALLNNAQAAHTLFGYPSVPIGKVMEWTADWVRRGERTYDKPTHFEVRSGEY